jgi:UDP-N-acetylglucosamine 2-epimerase (non-hydrolysing)
MPEEVNRVLTDHISNLQFTTEESANTNLLREGIAPERIHFVGNGMIDTLVRLLPKAKNSLILRTLQIASDSNLSSNKISHKLVTLHRPSNMDNPDILKEILAALEEISREIPVIFPVHPRTRQQIVRIGFQMNNPSLQLLEPLGYLDFLALLLHATLVLTDSGGVQEETTYLGVPCLTVRPNTERPVTITQGTNRLIRSDRESIVKASLEILNKNSQKSAGKNVPRFWDGGAAIRIVKVLAAQA